MNEQRKDILDMLAAGKITADEAEQLIAALEREQPPAAPAFDTKKGKAKYLRVLVDSRDAGEPGRVNIRVPLQLLRAGDRLRIEVLDQDTRLPTPATPDPHSLTGRGLTIVASLATLWGTERTTAGKLVWAEFDLSDRRSP